MALRSSVLWLLLAACGGTTIIDGSGGTDGQGGAGAATTSSSQATTSTSATTSGAGGAPADCMTLTDELTIALEAATACDACTDGPDPCEYLSGPQLTDVCGCPVAVNATQMDAVAKALEIYGIWVDQGCGPFECGQPCAVSDDPTCQAAAGCNGTCSP